MVHDTKKLDRLLDTIRKLKAKADDPATTEAESLAFAAKVAELLAQHGLEEAQLNVEDQEQLTHEDELMKNWNASSARHVLAWAVCRLFMVRAVRMPHNGHWILVGRKHNIAMVKDMTEYLIQTVARLGREYARKTPGGNATQFKRGCFRRVSERLDELRRQQAEQAAPQYTPTGNPGNLPALYQNERELSARYLQDRLGVRTKSARSVRTRWSSDAAAGYSAGNGVSLNRQMSGRSSAHLLSSK